MPSIKLSYARLKFFESIGKTITVEGHKNYFCSNVYFEEKYGISKEELIKLYSYNSENI